MPDRVDTPAEIELRFRTLLQALHGPASHRTKILRLHAFLLPLLDDTTSLDPYLPEAVEHIVRLTPQVSFVGIDPQILNDLESIVSKAKEHRPEISTLNGLETAMSDLRESAALLFAFVGEPGKAVDHLHDLNTEPGVSMPLQEHSEESLLERYRLNLKGKSTGESGQLSGWENLLNRWRQMIHQTRDGVVVPVIEQSLEGTDTGVAELRTIRLEVLGRSPNDSDRIDTNIGLSGPIVDSLSVFAPALHAARLLLHKRQTKKVDPHISCRILFEGDRILHSGESANLGIAALAHCVFERMMGFREQHGLQPGVAITGGIDAKGRVRAVNKATLEQKTRAVFFSWIEHFVVPHEQLEVVRETVHKLQMAYPRRHIDVRGVEHLRELFFDRRLTSLSKLGIVTYTAQRIWARRRIAAGAILLALLLLVGRLWYGPFDRNPTQWSIEGGNLVLRNVSGSTLEKIPIGMRTSVAALDNAHDFRQVATLVDVDGDGKNEVVWTETQEASPDDPALVHCKGIGEAYPRWTVLLERKMQFPNRADIQGGSFIWYRVDGGDYDGDGKVEIYVIARHSSFPSLLIKIDGATGNELGAYIHAGHLSDIRFQDLNGDGIREILLCGVNNSLSSACLVVLDPRRIRGYSPHASTEDLDSVSTGAENAYILIPRTIVGESFRRQVKYNIAESIRIHEKERAFSLVVRDAFATAPSKTDRLSSTVLPRFGYDFHLQSMETGDDFDVLYSYLVETRQTPPLSRPAYIDHYIREFNSRERNRLMAIAPPSFR